MGLFCHRIKPYGCNKKQGHTTNWNVEMHKQEPNYPKIDMLIQNPNTNKVTLQESGTKNCIHTDKETLINLENIR